MAYYWSYNLAQKRENNKFELNKLHNATCRKLLHKIKNENQIKRISFQFKRDLNTNNPRN